MCYASQDRNNMFKAWYMHVWQSKTQWLKNLNHVTSLFWQTRHWVHSSIIEKEYKEYCPGTMNIYFIPGQTRTEKSRLSRIPWHGLVLHKMLNIDCLCSTCQICQMKKKENIVRNMDGLLPPKIAESDILSLDHGLCGSGGSIYNKDTSQNTLSACTHNDRSSYQSLVGLKLSKPQISQRPATSTQDLFHNTWLARYPRPQFIVFDNGIEFKR
jgi:hypothetical protein